MLKMIDRIRVKQMNYNYNVQWISKISDSSLEHFTQSKNYILLQDKIFTKNLILYRIASIIN